MVLKKDFFFFFQYGTDSMLSNIVPSSERNQGIYISFQLSSPLWSADSNICLTFQVQVQVQVELLIRIRIQYKPLGVDFLPNKSIEYNLNS